MGSLGLGDRHRMPADQTDRLARPGEPAWARQLVGGSLGAVRQPQQRPNTDSHRTSRPSGRAAADPFAPGKRRRIAVDQTGGLAPAGGSDRAVPSRERRGVARVLPDKTLSVVC